MKKYSPDFRQIWWLPVPFCLLLSEILYFHESSLFLFLPTFWPGVPVAAWLDHILNVFKTSHPTFKLYVPSQKPRSYSYSRGESSDIVEIRKIPSEFEAMGDRGLEGIFAIDRWQERTEIRIRVKWVNLCIVYDGADFFSLVALKIIIIIRGKRIRIWIYLVTKDIEGRMISKYGSKNAPSSSS